MSNNLTGQKIIKKTRVIFMGTPEFALPGLEKLISAPNFEVVGVFTQPDKPVGRQQILSCPPIKTLAAQHQLKVFQPEKIKPSLEIIKELKPDLIVVIAYGKIIPPAILALPSFGCINVHASLLPKYRGAACLNAPILYGDSETGITIMKMDTGLDTGPILRQEKIQLSGQETLAEVHDKLAHLGADILIPTLNDYLKGKIQPQEQTEIGASYIKILNKEDGKISWQKSAQEIERMIRAFNPWPGTYTLDKNKIIKILAVDNNILISDEHQIGEVFIDNGRLAIQSGQNSLLILELQTEGKKAMNAHDFLNGNQNFIGKILQ